MIKIDIKIYINISTSKITEKQCEGVYFDHIELHIECWFNKNILLQSDFWRIMLNFHLHDYYKQPCHDHKNTYALQQNNTFVFLRSAPSAKTKRIKSILILPKKASLCTQAIYHLVEKFWIHCQLLICKYSRHLI